MQALLCHYSINHDIVISTKILFVANYSINYKQNILSACVIDLLYRLIL